MTIPAELESIARRLLAHRSEPDDGALLLRVAARVRFIMRELDEEPVVVAFPPRTTIERERKIHNRTALACASLVVRSSGDAITRIIALESIVTGVLGCSELGPDEIREALRAICEGVSERLKVPAAAAELAERVAQIDQFGRVKP